MPLCPCLQSGLKVSVSVQEPEDRPPHSDAVDSFCRMCSQAMAWSVSGVSQELGCQHLRADPNCCALCHNFDGCLVGVSRSIAILPKSALTVNARFTIALVCYVVLSPVTAVICYKFKSLRTLIIVGFVFFLAWAICMATTTLGSSSAVRGYQALLGAALAFVLNAVVASAQLSAPPELM